MQRIDEQRQGDAVCEIYLNKNSIMDSVDIK